MVISQNDYSDANDYSEGQLVDCATNHEPELLITQLLASIIRCVIRDKVSSQMHREN